MPDEPKVTIRRQRRRSLMMRVIPGGIEVYIPHHLREDDRVVRDFIAEGVAKLKGRIPDVPDEQTSRAQIKAMVADYAARMTVKASRVQFREMTRKWGSCSEKGTVTLNTRLTWLAPELVEYVVCHELAHLIELNHSPAFWAIVAQHMPDYQMRMRALRAAEKDL
jgi:predicted metal-dependent hydrolase